MLLVESGEGAWYGCWQSRVSYKCWGGGSRHSADISVVVNAVEKVACSVDLRLGWVRSLNRVECKDAGVRLCKVRFEMSVEDVQSELGQASLASVAQDCMRLLDVRVCVISSC